MKTRELRALPRPTPGEDITIVEAANGMLMAEYRVAGETKHTHRVIHKQALLNAPTRAWVDEQVMNKVGKVNDIINPAHAALLKIAEEELADWPDVEEAILELANAIDRAHTDFVEGLLG